MPRPLRVDFAGGWHHVMNRGAARQTVFFKRADGMAFQSFMAEGHERFGVEVHAFCLMTNHFHLLVRCPEAGLSRYMQHLTARYTQDFNRRQGRDGPIFRGRFHSLSIGSERYLAAVGRYIHRNPLDLGPAVDLAAYRWSSYRNYCGVSPPSWLSLSLAESFGGPAGYRRFVETDAEAGTSSVEWAIATAIAESEVAEDGSLAWIRRTVALLMLDVSCEDTRRRLERFLAMPTGDARRMALSRARKRVADQPILRVVADRAIELTS